MIVCPNNFYVPGVITSILIANRFKISPLLSSKAKCLEKKWPSTIMSTTNTTWNCLGSNLSVRNERSAIYRMPACCFNSALMFVPTSPSKKLIIRTLTNETIASRQILDYTTSNHNVEGSGVCLLQVNLLLQNRCRGASRKPPKFELHEKRPTIDARLRSATPIRQLFMYAS